MNKEEAIAKINAGEADDFVVFEKPEHETYLEKYAKTKVEEAQTDITRSIHTQYDDDLNDIFGERKQPNEKTYNFLKRKFSELKESAGQSEPLKAKIKEMEEKLKSGAGDEQLKSELEQVREEYKKEKAQWGEKEKEWEQRTVNFQLSTEIDKGMAGLKFDSNIPEAARMALIDRTKADIMKMAVIADGKLVFKDADGKTMLDSNLDPVTAEGMLSKQLEAILDTTVKKETPKAKETEGEDGKTKITLENPNAQSREEVTKYLKESGLANGSKEYIEAYKEFTKDLPPMK